MSLKHLPVYELSIGQRFKKFSQLDRVSINLDHVVSDTDCNCSLFTMTGKAVIPVGNSRSKRVFIQCESCKAIHNISCDVQDNLVEII